MDKEERIEKENIYRYINEKKEAHVIVITPKKKNLHS
jgi:hypothetical protein